MTTISSISFYIFVVTLAFTSAVAGDDRPNVLFIAIDDLRPELGIYGAPVLTPNIDRLARTGTRFDRAYCQQAVCGASRVSIMCSLYPTHTGEQTFHVNGWRKRHDSVVTINQHFRANGFQTIGLGKVYHNTDGPDVDRDNWDEWIRTPSRMYALDKNHEARMSARPAHGKKPANSQPTGTPKRSRFIPPPKRGPMTECADVPDDDYEDGQRAARAVSVLKDLAARQDQPFFFAVGFTKPHLPFTAPKKYWDLYERNEFAMPSNQAIPPGYPPEAANLIAHELRAYNDFEGVRPTDFSSDLNLRLLHGYAAATSYVDACVGRVLEALEDNGLQKNTIVVLWGDHGWKLGDHSSWCKHTNFECDTRVPLILRDPRHKHSGPSGQFVELLDIYPTLCDLVGIPVPDHCQGKSFRSQLTPPHKGLRQDAYSSYPVGLTQTGHSLRFGNYRYTEWRDNESGEVKSRVLTDLDTDPGEVTNVLDDPKHADALKIGTETLHSRIVQAQQ